MASYILDKSHELVAGVVSHGDTVVDATVGNGLDTVFLARLVGPTGRVIGFEIQSAAIAKARSLLIEEGLIDRCLLFKRTHAAPAHVLDSAGGGPPAAVMYNLGYLPGSDRTVTTTPETTVASVDAMKDRLAHGGILSIVAYRGHAGGMEEFSALEGWIRRLDRNRYESDLIIDPEGPDHAPALFVVRKR